jgi:mannan endo-1,4-beta-mannosidase
MADPVPVTPNPTPEAASLLGFLAKLCGRQTLTGQHCAPLHGSTRLIVVQRQTGEYPALLGQDFGFDAPGCWDGINFRQNVVDEAIRRCTACSSSGSWASTA